MAGVVAQTKSVYELLSEVEYKIDDYQREYQWGEKQVSALISDLVDKFEENYEEGHTWADVKKYSSYFLGSIIISEKEGDNYIVDGQQRLTSLTLFLIFLNNLKKNAENKTFIKGHDTSLDGLILFPGYGENDFNLSIRERMPCMQALYDGDVSSAEKIVESYSKTRGSKNSVRNLYECYQNIKENFPENLQRGHVLFYFIRWLVRHVNLVRMEAPSDEEAYTIFETMNDRGLSLSPTDMLKSFLLARIAEEKREGVNKLWKERIHELNDIEKEAASDFFKAWLRSQYATEWKDFELIGSEFHRWVGKQGIGKQGSVIDFKNKNDYLKFIMTDFEFYSEQYLRLLKASKIKTVEIKKKVGLEHICYNAVNRFSLQYMLLLAPLHPDDTQKEITKKIQITARYIDILLTWRLWNSQRIGQSMMKHSMLPVMTKIRAYRDRSASELGEFLFTKLQKGDVFNFDLKGDSTQLEGLYLKGTNGPQLRRILARMADFLELQSDQPSRFKEFMGSTGKPYELEHILSNEYEWQEDDFEHEDEFLKYRNYLGGILLLPKSVNASLGSEPYSFKLDYYFKENLLASSLHPNCYKKGHAGFKHFRESTGLKFDSIEDFKKQDIDERGKLYQEIAKLVWNPADLKK